MKLQDIKKKNIHSIPDRYFDQLPTRIQERVNTEKQVFGFSFNWNLILKIASPTLAVILIIFYINIDRKSIGLSADEILAQIETEDLIAYLVKSDISTDEIIEEFDLTAINLDFSEEGLLMQNIDMNDADIEMLMDEYELEGDLL